MPYLRTSTSVRGSGISQPNGRPEQVAYVYQGSIFEEPPAASPAVAERNRLAGLAVAALRAEEGAQRRAEYLRLLGEGRTREEAAAAVGVTPRTARRYERRAAAEDAAAGEGA